MINKKNVSSCEIEFRLYAITCYSESIYKELVIQKIDGLHEVYSPIEDIVVEYRAKVAETSKLIKSYFEVAN